MSDLKVEEVTNEPKSTEINQTTNVSPVQSKTGIKNLIKETVGNETSQAIIRIFDTKYISLKVFWLLCLLGCSSLCEYLVAQTCLTYLSYPVYTTTSLVHEMPTEFPKVTICNSAMATTEYALEKIRGVNNFVTKYIDIFDEAHLRGLSLNQLQLLIYQISIGFKALTTESSFTDESKQKLVHSFDKVLLECQFNGKKCNTSDFLWQWDPLYGNCYVFNSDAKMSKKSVLPGAQLGLKLNVYVGYHESLNIFNYGFWGTYGFASMYGLYVLVENNTFLSGGNNNVIALNGGTINFMSMQRRFTSKLPKPYSECDIDNTNPEHFDSPYYNLILQSPYQYSQELCVVQCMQEKVIQKCNSSIPYFVSLYNNSLDYESWCAGKTLNSDEIISIEPSVLNCLTHCPLECNSTEFKLSTTSQAYTGKMFEYIVKGTPEFASDFKSAITTETASNKFVQLNLYYDSLTFTTSSDTPSMDIVAFLGNVGGTLGLFLGVSVLSVCEFVHVIVESCILVSNRIKHKQKTSDIKVIVVKKN
jgi:hypothetical protein